MIRIPFSRPHVVVVTGASAGLGRATAHAYAREGADVALIARDSSALEEAAEEVRAHGVRALPLALDVSDAAAIDQAAARVEDELGQIDVWINNAMATIFAPVHRITADEFRRATEVTYLGAVYGTMAALRYMRPRDRGVIVQVGSALAYRSIPLQSPYCGAKHAIRGFTDAVRCELLHDGSGVHIGMVHMPALNTPQFDWALSRMPRGFRPVAPIYEPEIGAQAIVLAARRRKREMYVGESTFKAILGNKVAPGLLDRYLGMKGYEMQQTDAPQAPDQPSNLWQPVAGMHRTRGRFESESEAASPLLWLRQNRNALLGTAALALAALLSTQMDQRRRRRD
jgi:NAD(P)-dependent dehydrogenase (short-subunit alcohol dehydrogenase family)